VKLSDDSLFGWIGCLTLGIFYLIPAIVMYHWIGWWALLPGAAFWIIIVSVFHTVRKARSHQEEQ
jgi:hypothetical protein